MVAGGIYGKDVKLSGMSYDGVTWYMGRYLNGFKRTLAFG